MNQYKQKAVRDLLEMYAAFFIGSYDTQEALDAAIKDGSYQGKLYQDGEDGKPKLLAAFRLEAGEGKVMFSEDSTWYVWYADIMSRWYRENRSFLDAEAVKMITC